MRFFISFIISTVLLLTFAYVGLSLFLPKEEFDQLNIFAKNEVRYVQITEDGELVNRRYSYTLPAINDKGDERPITFTAAHNLRKNAFLKLETKGGYVRDWAEVTFESLPEAVQKAIND